MVIIPSKRFVGGLDDIFDFNLLPGIGSFTQRVGDAE